MPVSGRDAGLKKANQARNKSQNYLSESRQYLSTFFFSILLGKLDPVPMSKMPRSQIPDERVKVNFRCFRRTPLFGSAVTSIRGLGGL